MVAGVRCDHERKLSMGVEEGAVGARLALAQAMEKYVRDGGEGESKEVTRPHKGYSLRRHLAGSARLLSCAVASRNDERMSVESEARCEEGGWSVNRMMVAVEGRCQYESLARLASLATHQS